jgi:hypothetical protein
MRQARYICQNISMRGKQTTISFSLPMNLHRSAAVPGRSDVKPTAAFESTRRLETMDAAAPGDGRAPIYKRVKGWIVCIRILGWRGHHTRI